MGNHWASDTDLVVEEKTLFRHVGWRGHTGQLYPLELPPAREQEPGGYTPIYEQISTWVENQGWHD